MEEAPGNLEVITRYFTDFSGLQISRFIALDRVYKEWNEKINVISRKDIDSLYEKHVLHSLAIASVFKFATGSEIIDIGTGGGFPGIPLAIAFPDVQFHLVDSIGKKLKVVNEVVQALQLKNVTTQHIRAEEIKNRKFDFAVSRAVASLKNLWQWSRPLLSNKKKTEGFKNGLICMKGGDLTQEIHESGLKPHIREISGLFKEPFFREKYLLYIC
ncbi:16S rRNA (guanine(527)-N(7))-methyltransferase RsmG [Agriterribacter sp.]|uniref:16S rRNA (guanine(527)-N(7))-methyltransferase RsmG n=1 Tax=Agriterribacter sp. TaxID=2821509 RepID=UPI002D1D912F|nr:16S rRNA (guanine(527)-N(7))-methyltransferase RsmG [Agriterribacter sp.]HRP56865.1 16S rRNA (guanine(527)-N(7))-methyltransferase RsmG [Agriterribacter sp.]